MFCGCSGSPPESEIPWRLMRVSLRSAMMRSAISAVNGIPEFTRQVQQKAQENGLLLLSCGVYGNVIRFLYPLTIPDAQFSKALDILARILKS